MVPEEVKAQLGPLLKGEIRCREPLRAHTTWRIGGPADVMVFPESIEDIVLTMDYVRNEKIPVTIIGNGSNLLVSDEGIKGVVIKIANKLNEIRIDGQTIIAGGGVTLPMLSRKAADAGLTGLEFAAGIPASVGGAAVMNAGAHGGVMADVVCSVRAINQEGRLVTLGPAELGYAYRTSKLKGQGLIVVEVSFHCQPGDPEEIRRKIQANLQIRKNGQPLNYPNAGSVFKNPPGDSAGRLIEAAGGKGMTIGDAQVSAKHANFIVNLGEAKALEVIGLIEQIQSLVKDKFGLNLELEVQILGY